MSTTPRWRLAVAQHPMYLIIREDEDAAERIPPWGAPDIQAYIVRIDANLDAVERNPDIVIGYEWSGTELELLARDAPATLQRLVALVEQGRVGLYNGTYAQPHLHVISAESNVRQLAFGRRTYAELCGMAVRTYAHQEVSVHDQAPQLLRAFGLERAVMPGFLSTLSWISGGAITAHGVRGPRFTADRDLVAWEGLDGTTLPLHLHEPIPRDRSLRETLAHEAVIGSLGVPRLLVDMPDLVDIDQAWLAARNDVKTVLLDPELEAREAASPPDAAVRLTTNWSYLEGVRAEELSRTLRSTETAALRAESAGALAWLLCSRTPDTTRDIWRTILTSEHHDVFWSPGLRNAAIGWLARARKSAEDIAAAALSSIVPRLPPPRPGALGFVLVDAVPQSEASIVELRVPGDGLVESVRDEEGRPMDAEMEPAEDGGSLVRFVAPPAGWGYRVGSIRRDTAALGRHVAGEPFDGPLIVEHDQYRATVLEDGTISALVALPSGSNLVDPAAPSNRLSGTDSRLIGNSDETDEERQKRLAASEPLRGPWRTWEPMYGSRVVRSALGTTVRVGGRFGPGVDVRLTLRFYSALPRIDIRHEFTFDQASVGTFFDDASKLLLTWSPARSLLGPGSRARQDIPFGIIDVARHRSVFPTTWIDLSCDDGGLLFLHGGTPRHWLTDAFLVRLIGWGQDTDAIGNRLGRYRWLKSFDQRLDGLHVLDSAVWVHGRLDDDTMTAIASAFAQPPLVTWYSDGDASLPYSLRLVTADAGFHPSAVFADADRLVVRGHAGASGSARPIAASRHARIEEVRDLSGAPVIGLAPWRIGEIRMARGTRVNARPEK